MSRAIAWFWFDETQQVGQLEQIANLFKGTKVVVMDVPEDKELEEFAKVAGVDPSEDTSLSSIVTRMRRGASLIDYVPNFRRRDSYNFVVCRGLQAVLDPAS
jgi:hypothetical protein